MNRAERVIALIQHDQFLTEMWETIDRNASLGYGSALFTIGNNFTLTEMLIDSLKKNHSITKIEGTITQEDVTDGEETWEEDIYHLYVEFKTPEY